MSRVSYWNGRKLLVDAWATPNDIGIGQREEMLCAVTLCCKDELLFVADHMLWCCAGCLTSQPQIPLHITSGCRFVQLIPSEVTALRQWVADWIGMDAEEIILTVFR